MVSAQDALERLKEGNRRFVAGANSIELLTDEQRRAQLIDGQAPFAIILGCADSRVPAEIVFDQGLGDLFVVRVAGNIVAPSQVGSVEFAAAEFGTRLVVVLGHTCCGAVNATLSELRRPSDDRSPNLASIVDRIRPGVQALLDKGDIKDADALLDAAVRSNVRASVEGLLHGSQIIEDLVARDGLLIVGAEYSLETGRVDFFAEDQSHG